MQLQTKLRPKGTLSKYLPRRHRATKPLEAVVRA